MFQHRPARRPRLQHRLGRTRGPLDRARKRGPRRDRRAPGAGFAGSADSFNPSNMPRRGFCSAAGVRSIGRGVKSANMPRSGAAEDPREDPRSGGEISARGSRPASRGASGKRISPDNPRRSAKDRAASRIAIHGHSRTPYPSPARATACGQAGADRRSRRGRNGAAPRRGAATTPT
jgi:hypothetical protein